MIETKLPTPSKGALAHSEAVSRAVRSSIAENGPISFSDYMQQVLYAPGLGYYMVGNQKLGETGDFITAPETSELFGYCVASQVKEVLQLTGGDILEFGAGTGALASSILHAMSLSGTLPDRYCILEPSAELSERQKSHLKAALPDELYQRCHWLDALPTAINGVVIANEVIDAMPVERFVISDTSGGVSQEYVDTDDNQLKLIQKPACKQVVQAVHGIQDYLNQELSEGYRSEVNLLLEPWLVSIGKRLTRGLILLIDYGYPQQEYYLPERVDGTLRCYYQHQMHEDPLLVPGLQDITADVDFTRLVMACEASGLELHGYTSQAQFLLGCGLLEYADALPVTTEVDRYRVAQQVKSLSMASAMGERFQVMGLSSNLNAELRGFSRLDLSYRL